MKVSKDGHGTALAPTAKDLNLFLDLFLEAASCSSRKKKSPPALDNLHTNGLNGSEKHGAS